MGDFVNKEQMTTFLKEVLHAHYTSGENEVPKLPIFLKRRDTDPPVLIKTVYWPQRSSGTYSIEDCPIKETTSEVLWKNAAPYSNFGAQTITIGPAWKYDIIYIVEKVLGTPAEQLDSTFNMVSHGICLNISANSKNLVNGDGLPVSGYNYSDYMRAYSGIRIIVPTQYTFKSGNNDGVANSQVMLTHEYVIDWEDLSNRSQNVKLEVKAPIWSWYNYDSFHTSDANTQPKFTTVSGYCGPAPLFVIGIMSPLTFYGSE